MFVFTSSIIQAGFQLQLSWLVHALHPCQCSSKLGTYRLSVFQIGSTSVQLAETQLTFKSVPFNMDSTRIAIIYNTGPNHTYFKVPPHAHTPTHTCIHACAQILNS